MALFPGGPKGRPGLAELFQNRLRMRQSTFSIATHLYRRLAAMEVVRQMTGGVYKDARPADSDREDIVVQVSSAVFLPGDTARAQVLIYSSPVFSDRGDAVELIPDYKRLEYLCAQVTDGLDEVLDEGCLTWVEAQTFSQEGEMFCVRLEVALSVRSR